MSSFSFDCQPFVAMIGDIVSSKELTDRKTVQQKLNSILSGINRHYQAELASPFMITLGDEFQGLLKTGAPVADITERIEREMHPVNVRFGIGVGGITTDIDPVRPLGADGPAYHHARDMIDSLKAQEKKHMQPKTNIMIKIEGHADLAALINAVFSLNTVLKSKWTERQREIIKAYIEYNEPQIEIARRLRIHHSNVQKALSSADFYTYRQAVDEVEKVLSAIGEGQDV